jgi:hypothetical protein
MAALVRNYTIERGIQFSRQITIYDLPGHALDLTGSTIEGEIRLSRLPTDIRSFPTGTGPLVTNFDITIAVGSTGVFTFALTIVKTLLLIRADYDFDLVLTPLVGSKQRLVMGLISSVDITSHD